MALGCAPGPYRPLDVTATLLEAAEYGSAKAVERHLSSEAALEEPDMIGRTPLMLAASSMHAPVENLHLLIAAGADLDATDDRGYTALMHASTAPWMVQHGRSRPYAEIVERVHLLIESGSNVNARDHRARTVLMVSAAESNAPDGRLFETLLEAGAVLEDRDPEGLTALMHAAAGRGGNVAHLLTHGAAIDAQDNQGRTALMLGPANRWAGSNVVEVLINAGAALEVRDQRGWSALAHAAWHGRTLYPAKRLLEAGTSLEPLGWSPLHAAALVRDAAATNELLESGAGVNDRDRWGRTPLMWASRYISEDTSVIDRLIGAGADVNASDHEGATALHIASKGAWVPEVRALLVAGAEVNARDAAGRTPLIWAVIEDSGYFRAEALLAHGAEIDAADNDGRTALIHAVRRDRADANEIKMLREAGADPSRRDSHGRSAMDYAHAASDRYSGKWVIEALEGHRQTKW